MAADCPRLFVVTAFPPSRRFSGVILHNLLRAYPADRLAVVANGFLLDELARDATSPLLTGVTYWHAYPWRSNWRGLRRLLRSLNVLKVLPLARSIARSVG